MGRGSGTVQRAQPGASAPTRTLEPLHRTVTEALIERNAARAAYERLADLPKTDPARQAAQAHWQKTDQRLADLLVASL